MLRAIAQFGKRNTDKTPADEHEAQDNGTLRPGAREASHREHAQEIRHRKPPAEQCSPEAQEAIAARCEAGEVIGLYPSGVRGWWYVDESHPASPGISQWCAAVWSARWHIHHGLAIPQELARMALTQASYTSAYLWNLDGNPDHWREYEAIWSAAGQEGEAQWT